MSHPFTKKSRFIIFYALVWLVIAVVQLLITRNIQDFSWTISITESVVSNLSFALLGLLALRYLLRLRCLLCLLALFASLGSPICLYLAFDRAFVVSVVASTLQSPPTVVYGVRWDNCVKSDGTYQSLNETCQRWTYSNLSKVFL